MPKLIETPDHNEFIIPASDTKGHSARQWFRCIPAMARQVEQVIQSREFPYRTKGDILRHALHRHIHWLSTVGDVKSITGQVDAILEVLRDDEMNKDFSLVFAKLEERITHYLSEGEDREATRIVMMVQGYIREMPDGFWKSKYQKRLEDKFSRLIKGSTKLQLVDIQE